MPETPETFHAVFESAAPVQVPAWVLSRLIEIKDRYDQDDSLEHFDIDLQVSTNTLAITDGFYCLRNAGNASDGGHTRVVVEVPSFTIDPQALVTISVDYFGPKDYLDLGVITRHPLFR